MCCRDAQLVLEDAQQLVKNGCKVLAEVSLESLAHCLTQHGAHFLGLPFLAQGANMPSTNDAISAIQEANFL